MVTYDLPTSSQGDRAGITISLSQSRKLKPWKPRDAFLPTPNGHTLQVVEIRLELGPLDSHSSVLPSAPTG